MTHTKVVKHSMEDVGKVSKFKIKCFEDNSVQFE